MDSFSKDIKIFTGNSNPALANELAAILGRPMGKSEAGKFSDGETNISIGETVRGSDVFLVQSTCNPVNDHLMELLVMVDAVKRASAGRITAVIPYFGYARQDRKSKARDPITAKLVANLITAAGADRVLTMDLHAAQIQGFFDIPLDHLQGVPILAEHIKSTIGNPDDYVVVSPDLGATKLARNFAKRIGTANPIAIVDKRRPKANVSEVMNIIGDVKGKKVILVDELIDTAGTLCNAAAALIEIGGAIEVMACATHGVLSGPAIERIEASVIKQFVMIDTIPLPAEKKCDKIKFLSAAPIFAGAIERIHDNRPVSTIFD